MVASFRRSAEWLVQSRKSPGAKSRSSAPKAGRRCVHSFSSVPRQKPGGASTGRQAGRPCKEDAVDTAQIAGRVEPVASHVNAGEITDHKPNQTSDDNANALNRFSLW